ncbi:MAG: amino acid racemase [Bacteroidetes bacterium]|nr:amino acid racemase [Bacteroidota bacterium]
MTSRTGMKICGIIGGVGPSATVQLMRDIIENTPARRDQDHVRLIVDNHPQIPDRTEHLLQGGASPVPLLAGSVRLLMNAGADFIACPCNTAHHFLRPMAAEMGFELIDMIEVTVRHLSASGVRVAGLLSTSGTAKTGIYQETGKRFGVEILSPSGSGINDVMEAVYGVKGIKAGPRYEKSRRNRQLLQGVAGQFEEKGIDVVIMGCTEIPLSMRRKDTRMELVNPTELLAREIVRRCKERA